MFVFAGFTKEDRQKVRAFKVRLMTKLTDKKEEGLAKETSGKEPSVVSLHSNADKKMPQDILSENNPFQAQVKETGLSEINYEISDNVISYPSREKEGTIGTFSDTEEDRISDNFFTIDVPAVNKENTVAYLEYDLFGLASHQSVSRSINHNVAIGGDIVIPSAKWSHQREAVSSNLIKNGLNTILFTSPSEGVKYKVKNLKIVFDKDNKSYDNIIVSSVLSGSSLYVKGNNINGSGATINNEYVSLKNGEFEKLIQVSESDKAKGSFSVTTNGVTNNYKIPAETASFKTFNNAYSDAKGISVSKDQEFSVDYEGINIKVEKETSEAAYLEVLKLRAKDFPATSQGLKNVTVNNSAYRLSVISGKLNKKVKLTIPYDEKRLGLIPAKEIKIFHFDYAKKQWAIDQSAVVDTKTKTVTVEGDGDTDYINGVISVPESPQTNASSPTGISGIKTGDPTAGRVFMQPPTASQQGDANLSYPIEIPSGRNGLQPNLSITYSSSKSNGWMGEGWDVNGISSIDLDTRWGSPSFDPSNESELYSLDGEMLVYENNYLPQRHSDGAGGISTVMQPRNTSGYKSFYLRKGHDFSKIERYGNSPDNYRFVITSTNGTKSYYGGDESSVNSQSVLRAVSGQIIKWGVYKIEDTYLNNIKFYYDNVSLGNQSAENANLSEGKIFNIKSIYYTGKDGNDGGYSIVFEKESSILRKDLTINAKQGAKQVEPYRLKMIKIFDNLGYSTIQHFRSYQFFYSDGEFNKSLLTRFWVAEQDHYYNTYNFDYHNELKNGSTVLPTFGPDTSISTFQADSSLFNLPSGLNTAKINSTYTKEEGATIRLSFMLNFGIFNQDPYGHIILYSMMNSTSRAQSKGAQQLVDFNGDGVPDILYKKNNGLYIRPGIISDTGVVTGFGIERMVQNLQSNFAFTDTKNKSRGKDFGGSISFLGWSIFANTSNVTTSSKSTIPTYLIDANSDGLMDVVDGKDVWFNKLENGTPAFTKFSASTENMVIKANPVAPVISPVLPKDDVIKFWIAPRDGYIRFHDDISIENVNGANAIYSVEMPYFDGNSTKAKRIYLTKLTAGMSVQSIDIRRYNDYFSQIQGMPPLNQFNHLGVNSSDKLYVRSGQKVYIRLHQNEDDNFKVNSNPLIVYVDSAGIDLPNNNLDDQDGFRTNNGNYASNFILNNYDSGLKLDHPGNVVINVPAINFNPLNDDIKIRFVIHNLITNQVNEIYSQPYNQSTFGVNIAPITLNANITDSSVLMCLVESVSHTAYQNTGLNDITVNYTTGGNSYTLNLVPRYNSYYITDHKPKIKLGSIPALYPAGVKTYGVQVNKNIPLGQLNYKPDCTFIYVVKIAGQVIGKRKVFISHMNNVASLYEVDMINNQTISGINAIPLYTIDLTTTPIPRRQEFSIQVYFENSNDRETFNTYRSLLAEKMFNIYYDNDVVLTSIAETSVNSAGLNPISKINKNWGQFLYRDEYGRCALFGLCDEYGVLIDIYEPTTSINTAACNHLTDPQAMQACVAQNSSMNIQNNVFPLTTYKIGAMEKWKGAGPEQYSSATAFKDDEFATGVFNASPFDTDPANIENTSNIGPNSEMTRMKAADKIYLSSSKTKSYSGGASGNIGVGANLGYSESSLIDPPGSILIQDFTDLNGDGYPDFLSKENIQVTFPTGGHKQQQSSFINDYVTISDNYQNAITLGANFNVKAFKTTGSNAKNGADRATTSQADNSTPWSPGVGVSSSFNFDSKDFGKAYWMDINGDGLIDRISNASSSGFSCSLNYGNGMFGATSFYNSSTYASRPVGSAGMSFGGSLSGLINSVAGLAGNFGLDIGVGASKSAGNPEKLFEDVNGDGLVDILSVNSAELNVNYNLGNKFADQQILKKDSGTQNINFTEDITNLNGYGMIGGHVYLPIGPIPILPIPGLFLFNLYIKIGVDASANIGMTISEVKKSFKDMNGDGYNDLIRYEGNNLIVNYSRIGKTNKLKQVTNQDSSSTFTIDYQYTKPDYNDPNARLVMSEVKIFNPDVFSSAYTTSTTDKDIVTRFKYDSPKYDRRERVFLGFEKVTTDEMDAGNVVYRKHITNFYNKSYHTAGLVKSSELLSAGNTLMSRNKSEYTLYIFNSTNTQLIAVNPNEFETFDAGGQEGRRMAVVLPVKTTSTQFENGGSVETSSQMSYTGLGLLRNYLYTSPTLSYNSEITYHTGLSNNIISVPKTIDVYDGAAAGGLLLKHRETSVNSYGDINQIKVKLNNSEFAVTDLTYNNYGNLMTIKYPVNDYYARYQLDYKYDAVYNKYVESTTNAFNETSTAEYDSRFDLPTKTTDIAGNSTDYVYDNIGRIVKITGPRENALPPTSYYGRYTIMFDYGIVAKTQGSLINIYRSVTRHYNESDPENPIETISFSDGFGRVIQTKKDIEHLDVERMVISGITEYDLFGRAVKQHHPNSENKASNPTNILNVNNYLVLGSPQPHVSTMQYDIRDRITQSVTEDNVATNTKYDIDNGLYKTDITIPAASQQSQILTNAEGKTVASINYLNGQPLKTSFTYNTVGELLETKDPEGIPTSYTYDMGGRMLSVLHPDRGTTTYKYDPSGNITRKYTDNISNDPAYTGAPFILYFYQYNRLINVHLPNLPNGSNPNNIQYIYGDPGTGNNTGKLIYKSDATGFSNYEYGISGELISENRTIYGNYIQPMNFITTSKYDSWNRLTELVYPDGEKLSYQYDFGGNLKKVVNNDGYQYISGIKYDEYGQRQSISYGNGTQSNFSYNNATRRLQYHRLTANNPSNPVYLLSNYYHYDPVGNIIKLENGTGVSPNEMGGTYKFEYGYDTLNRLIRTKGEFRMEVIKSQDEINPPVVVPGWSPYSVSNSTIDLRMIYNESGSIKHKGQVHYQDLNVNTDNTYENNYHYDNHKLMEVYDTSTGQSTGFEYDYNGNVVAESTANGANRMYWDEYDRMRAYYNDNTGVYQYYTYDNGGERTIKYNLAAGSQLYQNGTLVDPGSLTLNDYKIYSSPQIVVSSNGTYSKHYFEGSARFASRVIDGTDIFVSSTVKVSGNKSADKAKEAEADFSHYLKKAGLSEDIVTNLGSKAPPGGGQGKLFYLHGDHLGTATFVTDINGETTQFFLNLPFGETMAEQMTGAYDNPYKFNAKELDAETGFYYYGARYYNPKWSQWYGVDPLAEKMPSWSPYVYTFDNPIKYVDPDGKAPIPPDIITKVLSTNNKMYPSGTQYYSRNVSITMTVLIYNPERLDLSKSRFNKSQGVINWKEFKGQAQMNRGSKMIQDDNIQNLAISYKVITDDNDIKGTANVMTVTSKDVYRNSDNSNAAGLTDYVGGQIGIVEYNGGNFDGYVYHEFGHMLGIEGEGYEQPYPNENSNTIMDVTGNKSVTTQQKAKAAFVPINAKKDSIYKNSARSSNFHRSSELKEAVQDFNKKNTR